jgi:agmatinase
MSNKLNFISCDASFENADIVLYGVPFDSTTSFRPGTRFAPNVIRLDSDGIETYSVAFNKDIEEMNIADNGDVDVVFGNAFKTLENISTQAAKILDAGKKPLLIGGEHLVTYGQFREVYKKYDDVVIIHFDAHADLRDDYLGEKLSHATVLRRCFDLVGQNRIYQFGIRSGEKSEFEFAKDNTIMEKVNADTISEVVSIIKDKPIYLTIDLDVLDPSIFSGTGTPEPGGLTYKEFIHALKQLTNLNIVGADIVELAPHYDHSGVSNAVACKTVREVLCLL